MRKILLPMVALACFSAAGCDRLRGENAVQDIDLTQEGGINDVMRTVADPGEAVAYFRSGLENHPNDPELLRGLGESLIRAGRPTEAITTFRQLVALPAATSEDRVSLADAYIRSGDWTQAATALNQIPPTHETYKRYRLEAMVADSKKDWARADSFYETAVGLTTKPAGVLNNWGYSKLTRGEFAKAEQLFAQAVQNDPTLFTAKNNLVLARAAQRSYTLPVVPMTQIERAQLLHTAGLSAVKQGDVATAKGLFQEAISTHPQHFEPATRALAALEANVRN